MYRLILKNSAIYGILPQLPKVASFFILPFITPFLTASDYGIIGVIEVYMGLLTHLHLLGFAVVVTNSFYKEPETYIIFWRQIYGFLMLWSIVFILVLGIVIYFILPEEVGSARFSIVLIKIVPVFLFAPAELFMSTYYRLRHKAWPIATRSVLAGGISVGFNFYFIAVMKLGYLGWIYSAFITAIISGLLFFIPLIRELRLFPIFKFNRQTIFRSLKISLPMLPHNYSSYLLNSSDRLIMDRMNISVANIGLYSLAYNLGSYVNIVTGAISQAISPNLLECIRSGRWKDYQDIVMAFQTMLFLSCFTIALWVANWMPLLIRNENLMNIQSLFIVVLMSYCYRPMYIGCNQVLFYFENTNILWKISTAAGVINITLNILLIPFFGFKIAVFTTFGAFMFMGFSGFLHRHSRDLNHAALRPLFWLVTIIVSLIVLLLSFELGDGVKLVINASAIVAMLFFLNTYSNLLTKVKEFVLTRIK